MLDILLLAEYPDAIAKVEKEIVNYKRIINEEKHSLSLLDIEIEQEVINSPSLYKNEAQRKLARLEKRGCPEYQEKEEEIKDLEYSLMFLEVEVRRLKNHFIVSRLTYEVID